VTTIKMDRISSSNLHSVGYDEASKRLRIRFGEKGRLYEYAQVPPEIAASLRAAKSPGGYFHANVKNAYGTKIVDEVAEAIAAEKAADPAPPK